MKTFFPLVILISQFAFAGSHTDLIPGSAFYRFIDLYGVYSGHLSEGQDNFDLKLRMKKIEGYSGLYWFASNKFGRCHGRYKIPLVGKVNHSPAPVIIVYGEGECYLNQKRSRFASAFYFPHVRLKQTSAPLSAVIWHGGINGHTYKFTKGVIIKTIPSHMITLKGEY